MKVSLAALTEYVAELPQQKGAVLSKAYIDYALEIGAIVLEDGNSLEATPAQAAQLEAKWKELTGK